MADERKTGEPEEQIQAEAEYTFRCPMCGEPLPDTISVCPVCGARLKTLRQEKRYQPIGEKTARIIRWIVGVACLVGFVLIYVFVIKK